ncbi:hypothetical protein D3C84_739780 [compost metagenome]
MVVRQLVARRAVGARIAFANLANLVPFTDRVAEVRVVLLRQGHAFVRGGVRLANHHRHFQKLQPQFPQDPVHVIDTGLPAPGQPMADAALGHSQPFCEHHLRDAQLLHLGLDQLYPFIHVRHDTWMTPTIQNTNCSI